MNQVATIEAQPRSVLLSMAHRYGMEPAAFEATVRATCSPVGKGGQLIALSREQFAAFLVVAMEYGLNPLTKEIYAFPTRNGGIQPVVSVDGWMNLINSKKELDGIEFDDHPGEEGGLAAITARIWRKDRSKPIVVTEYMAECERDTDTWRKWPRRMLRHKAAIQCARYAFGFSGIVDPDEADRHVSDLQDITPPPAPAIAAPKAPSAPIHVPLSGRGRKPEPEIPDHMQGEVDEDLHRIGGAQEPAEGEDTDPVPEEPETEERPTASNTEAGEASEMGPDESQKLRAEALAFLKGATTEKAIETWLRNNVEPKRADLFPGDLSDIERARDAALKRLAGDA